MESTRIKEMITDKFKIKYFSFGSGAKTFVMLPGLSVRSVMNDAKLIAKAYENLEEEYTVYVFDRREDMPDPYDVCSMARDTAEAMKELGLKDVYLFGASQGGMMALVIAAEYPELVHRMVLGSAAAHVGAERFSPAERPSASKGQSGGQGRKELSGLARWVELAEAGEKTELYLDFGRTIYPPNVYEMYKAVLAGAAEDVTEEDLRRFVILAKGTVDYDMRDRLDEIRCPVLVLGAVDDRVLGPDAARELADGLMMRGQFASDFGSDPAADSGSSGRQKGKAADRPVTEVYIYDGYGHAAFDTAPDFKDRIMAFFAGKEQ